MNLVFFFGIVLLLAISLISNSYSADVDEPMSGATFAQKYKEVIPQDSKQVSILVKVAGTPQSTNPENRAKEIRYLQTSVLKFVSLAGGINIESDKTSNEFTAEVHPVVVKLLEKRNDVLYVAILNDDANTKDSAGCKDNLRIIIKKSDNTLACVKFSTFPVLVERGWGYEESIFLELELKNIIGSDKGSKIGQFNIPADVVLDNSNNIYVADYGNHRIQKFDTTGQFVGGWGSFGTENGQFNTPVALAFDGKNQLAVSDEHNHRIQKFDTNGDFVLNFGQKGTQLGEFDIPTGMVFDKDDNLFVSDWENNRVQKFDSDGNFLFVFGTHGIAKGEFNQPWGIDIDSNGDLYVADTNNNRIQKFDSDGNFILSFGRLGSGPGQLDGPADIAIDNMDKVYVVDWHNSRIQKFDSDGNFISILKSDQVQLKEPWGITLDSSGKLYVADVQNHRIFVYSE